MQHHDPAHKESLVDKAKHAVAPLNPYSPTPYPNTAAHDPRYTADPNYNAQHDPAHKDTLLDKAKHAVGMDPHTAPHDTTTTGTHPSMLDKAKHAVGMDHTTAAHGTTTPGAYGTTTDTGAHGTYGTTAGTAGTAVHPSVLDKAKHAVGMDRRGTDSISSLSSDDDYRNTTAVPQAGHVVPAGQLPSVLPANSSEKAAVLDAYGAIITGGAQAPGTYNADGSKYSVLGADAPHAHGHAAIIPSTMPVGEHVHTTQPAVGGPIADLGHTTTTPATTATHTTATTAHTSSAYGSEQPHKKGFIEKIKEKIHMK